MFERLAGEFVPKVNKPRPVGNCATGRLEFRCPRVLLVTVTPSGNGTDGKSSSPLLL